MFGGVKDVTADADLLVGQAIKTADIYLSDAIVNINERLGDGYEEKHPELLGHFMMVCAMDFQSAIIRVLATEIRDPLNDIASAINSSRELSRWTMKILCW